MTGLNLPLMSMPHLPPAIAVALFYRDVLRVGLVLLAIAAGVAALYGARRPRAAPANPGRDGVLRARRVLALGLGGLWVLDGLLQLQPAMVTSFVSGLVGPLLQGQPAWLSAVMDFGVRLWGVDPVVMNVLAAFVQLACGILILAGGEGPLRGLRRAGLWISIGWGLVVWIFGEALGSVFVSGSFLSGAPGAVLFYMIAAALLLAPTDYWRAGGWLRAFGWGMAALWLLAAVLQAWPPAGYWTGGGLYGYVSAMGEMSQPHLFAVPLLAWAGALRAHPQGWNAAIVLGLLALGVAWMRWPGRRWVWAATIAWQFAAWWFGEDFGVLGGMGTDPNTGPIVILLVATYATALRAGWSARAGRGRSLGPAFDAGGVRLAGGRLR